MKKKIAVVCCENAEAAAAHPDHSRELNRINRILGQIEGIKRMVAARDYCPKIITQIQAARSALRSLESVVLEKHLEMCVRQAFESSDPGSAKAKIEELVEILRRNA
jgi:CsoR family transcriptional regulator, copper-sensing transcriptional repressor